jgi:hypothetical protein
MDIPSQGLDLLEQTYMGETDVRESGATDVSNEDVFKHQR